MGGYNGRTNKTPDSCYSFWIGATLSLLGCFELTDVGTTRMFLLNGCQFTISFSASTDENPNQGEGWNYCTRCGFCKVPRYPPDVLHTYYSLAWLALSKDEVVEERTSISEESLQEIRSLKSFSASLGIPRCGFVRIENE